MAPGREGTGFLVVIAWGPGRAAWCPPSSACSASPHCTPPAVCRSILNLPVLSPALILTISLKTCLNLTFWMQYCNTLLPWQRQNQQHPCFWRSSATCRSNGGKTIKIPTCHPPYFPFLTRYSGLSRILYLAGYRNASSHHVTVSLLRVSVEPFIIQISTSFLKKAKFLALVAARASLKTWIPILDVCARAS